MILPSYYGEGLPKILIEAAACARPVITTNHPGCRDAIIPEETGILVPIKDVNALVQSIKNLLGSKDRIIEMGKKARLLAENKFDINEVIRIHLSIYLSLLDNKRL